jgi:DtxR family Mn-dependent transcriptional regulator
VHEPYRGVKLTPAGRKAAVEVIRHHRLLEQYLAETLGLPIDAVHDEADRLEHALSEELEARIDETLGFPTHDPHGDPIPDADLNVGVDELRPLHALGEGERSTVRRVPDDTALLRYLRGLGLLPGAVVEVVRRAPSPEPVVVATDGVEHAISFELASQIGVS